jgi:myo-inositol-1(or 4)-monophosphatase
LPDSDRTKEAIEVRDHLAAVVREAGQLALPKFGTQFKSWTKDKSSPVTEVDIAVDTLLHERLAAIAPDYGWLSEETADDRTRTASRRLWIVDPIDGTRAFIAGIPEWTIVAALVEDGRPIAGAVFQPATDAMYTAAHGAGARLNGKPIMASGGDRIDGARAAGPKSYLSRISEVAGRMEFLPKIHSLALRLARVADGTVDIAFTSANSRDWDLAAADLLVHEAGGALTTLDGEPLRYNRPDPVHDALMAAGRMRHATLVDLIRDRRAEFA